MSNDNTGQTSQQASYGAAEWAVRVDLAAAYRLVEHNGWGEAIFNHITARVPGSPREFLIKRYDLLYDEVTASNLIKVSMDADLDEQSAGVNRPGFVLHSNVLRARADVQAVLHLHTPNILAISALKRGLRMLSQYSVRFYKRIGYHDYEGITDGAQEGPRIIAALGQGNSLILRNHGALTATGSVSSAFVAMSYLIEAARIQLLIESAGGETVEIAPEICEHVAKQFERHDSGRGAAEWPSLLRRLDREDSSYKF